MFKVGDKVRIVIPEKENTLPTSWPYKELNGTIAFVREYSNSAFTGLTFPSHPEVKSFCRTRYLEKVDV